MAFSVSQLKFIVMTFVVFGVTEAHLPKNCKEWMDQGLSVSGVYMIQPVAWSSVAVYCDMTTDGGGWTIFQRRLDGSVDFYREWWVYVGGFGSAAGEYWLGLAYIHALTLASPQELRVDMSDFEGASRYAKYSTFSVGDDLSGYTLSVSGYNGTAAACPAYDRPECSTRDGHLQSESCASTAYVKDWCPYMCGKCQESERPTCEEDPDCFESPAGCIWLGKRGTAGECASRSDEALCESIGGEWGCKSCYEINVHRYCAEMCGYC